MNKEKIKQILIQNGYNIILDKRYKNIGYRLKIAQGSIIICYDKQGYYCQGKLAQELENLILKNYTPEEHQNNKIFIVYGHDLENRNKLLDILETWGLEPLAIDKLPTQGRTIIEQLEKYIPQTNYGIVLFSPDDVAIANGTTRYRARQNVVLELGMLLMKLGRKKVSILIKKANDIERPTDIDGILYISYTDNINEVKEKLKRELNSNGYNIK